MSRIIWIIVFACGVLGCIYGYKNPTVADARLSNVVLGIIFGLSILEKIVVDDKGTKNDSKVL